MNEIEGPSTKPGTPHDKPSIAELQRELSCWPEDWRADIDDPGTENEEWTGKWHALSPDHEDTEVEVDVPDYGVDLAKHLARLHNDAPALLQIAAAALAWKATLGAPRRRWRGRQRWARRADVAERELLAALDKVVP